MSQESAVTQESAGPQESAVEGQSAACAAAHGAGPDGNVTGTLVAVFASPVARLLLRYGGDIGYATVLVEPEPERAAEFAAPEMHRPGLDSSGADSGGTDGSGSGGGHCTISHAVPELDEHTDVVVTDHHREELGPLLAEVLAQRVRWVGVMGNPRHSAPHVPALQKLHVPDADIERVHRPIGLNIGSRAPAEIAIATVAGLLAERNGKPGGFAF